MLKQQFDDLYSWDKEAWAAGQLRRVFWQSMGDLFEDREEFVLPRLHAYAAMVSTPNLMHIVLTKLPQNFEKMLPPAWYKEAPKNVCGMVTVGTTASKWRIDYLLKAPFAVRGISVEPLIDPELSLEDSFGPFCTSSKEVHDACHDGGMWCDEASIDWVIIGGESGGGARPCHVETIRRLLRECRASAVVPYVKQLGAHVYGDQFEFFDPLEAGTAPGFGLSDRKGADPSEWPEDLRIQRYPPAFLRLQ
jgi:protein gp37